ncbi:MAG TPA: tetratricopeptide repeat protein [Candidatus Coprenecus stercoravium]|uniref:Tetratricopeptide repeat protein n=1 Tax=Candidatus Coprenecus stercoravium TaxID=2840735 RepID=A0A9D2KAI0_9BACT|nr:tetratricopeptide repeat protein [Candidatus Coprenecus stercoravium]
MNRFFLRLSLSVLILSFPPAVFAAAVQKDSVSADDYFIEGVRLYCAGEDKEAAEMFSRCLELEPDNDAALYYTAMLSLSADSSVEASAYLDKAISLSPENQWYRLMLARLYAGTGDIGPAVSIYDSLIAGNPGKSDYYYELIELYVKNSELDKALETLDQVELLKGATELTGNARYEILGMQGRYDEAKDVLKKMDEDFPSSRTAMILGDLYKAKYDDSTALHYYNRSIELNPDFTPAYFGMAEIYRIRRDFYNFFKYLNKFLCDPMMDPQLKTNYIEEIIFASGLVPVFRPQVDTLVENTMAANPADTSVLTMAGLYFIAVDSVDKGMEILRVNIEHNPDAKSPRAAYMGQLYGRQKWDELAAAAEETIEKFPQDFMLREFLAIAYWRQDKAKEAVEVYNDILRLIPSGHPMLINCYAAMGDLYYETGNRRKAYSCYEKGLRIDDSFCPILNNYAYFLSEEGRNLKKALEMSRKTIISEPENATYLDTYGWLLYLTGDYEEARDYLKKAMIYGGKESAVILDHYAEALFALKDYNLAFLYWSNAQKLDPDSGLSEKIALRRKQCGR